MTTLSDYPSFGKIPRLSKPVIITEKIDGTNGLVCVERVPFGTWPGLLDTDPTALASMTDTDAPTGPDGLPNTELVIRAGSRNRWLTVERDNYGFAWWVRDNARELAQLGPGRHYGEWYGRSIQRGYSIADRRFALFNVARWYDERDEHGEAYRQHFALAVPAPDPVTVVPVLWVGTGTALSNAVAGALDVLRTVGSWAVPGYSRPEGVIAYHTAAGQMFKAMCEGDDTPKGIQDQA